MVIKGIVLKWSVWPAWRQDSGIYPIIKILQAKDSYPIISCRLIACAVPLCCVRPPFSAVISYSLHFLPRCTDVFVNWCPAKLVLWSPANWSISSGLTKSSFCTTETATSTVHSRSCRPSGLISARSSWAWKPTTTSTLSDEAPFLRKLCAGSPLMKLPVSEVLSPFGSHSVSRHPQSLCLDPKAMLEVTAIQKNANSPSSSVPWQQLASSLLWGTQMQEMPPSP